MPQIASGSVDSRPSDLKYPNQIRPQIVSRAFDYRDRTPQKNGWARFETTLHWATMHPDSGCEKVG